MLLPTGHIVHGLAYMKQTTVCSRSFSRLQWNTDHKASPEGWASPGVYVLITVYGGGKSGQEPGGRAEAEAEDNADWLVSLYNSGWSPA